MLNDFWLSLPLVSSEQSIQKGNQIVRGDYFYSTQLVYVIAVRLSLFTDVSLR